MDYNFQRALNALTPTISNHVIPKLTSTPARILINPGIGGQVTHLYPFYVPILTNRNIPYEIKKQVAPIGNEEQVGEGQNSESNKEPEPEISSLPSTLEENNESELSPSNEKANGKMSAGVAFAFKHPAISTDKLVFNRSKPKKQMNPIESRLPIKKAKMSESAIKHKFQFS